MSNNTLKVALALLMEHEAGEKYANLSLSSHKTDSLSVDEKRLLTALFYGVIESKIRYDYYIGAISARSAEDISPRARNILRLGICQLLDINSIPDYAAVNGSVSLAKSQGERAFVNGVLRELLRQKDSLPMPDAKKNFARYLSVKYSFPQKTVKHFINMLGQAEAEKLLCHFNSERYTDLSVNLCKISRDDLLKGLLKQGCEARLSKYSSIGIRIKGSVNPCNLFGYDEGCFFVQDEACAILSEAMDARRGQVILDVCAAPGGKSFAFASLTSDEAQIYSFDKQDSKLSLIENGAKRLSLNSITVQQRDALLPDSSLFGKADRVLCDVPCSGLGILGKKADIRYKDISSLEELPSLQYGILNASKLYLKKDGIMIYSTCTLNFSENEEVVNRFLEENSDFSLMPFCVGGLVSETGMLTLYPHTHSTDGFFIAKLRREN